MRQKQFMIAGLRKQRQTLLRLIRELEREHSLESADCSRYDRITKQVERNLKELKEFAREEFYKKPKKNRQRPGGAQ